MRMTRRTLLMGAGAGALGVLLVSCTPEPEPTRRPTRTPTPTPTGSVPVPAASRRSAWSDDPFARGATSVTPVGVQPAARRALAAPVDERVFFAGEATDAEQPGTLRGAMASGRRVADELVQQAAAGERIAVIGAGLAGATAAARLHDTGARVTVFEARDRVGGRIHSIPDKAWPAPIQLGAWLFAPDEELVQRLDSLEIPTAVLDAAAWRSADGEVEPPAPDLVPRALEAAQAAAADLPITDALAVAGADPEDPALAALLAAVAAGSGADPAEASAWFPPALPPDHPVAAAGDLGALVADLLDGIQVSLSSPVSRVAHDDTGVSLRLGTGESQSFDRVVVTVPLGVLQQGGIEFAPALPLEHRGAISSLGVGHIETIALRFDEPFWDTDATVWHVVGGEAAVRTWFVVPPDALPQDTQGADGNGELGHMLVGVVGAAAASDFAALDDTAAIEAALASLEPFAAPA